MNHLNHGFTTAHLGMIYVRVGSCESGDDGSEKRSRGNFQPVQALLPTLFLPDPRLRGAAPARLTKHLILKAIAIRPHRHLDLDLLALPVIRPK